MRIERIEIEMTPVTCEACERPFALQTEIITFRNHWMCPYCEHRNSKPLSSYEYLRGKCNSLIDENRSLRQKLSGMKGQVGLLKKKLKAAQK